MDLLVVGLIETVTRQGDLQLLNHRERVTEEAIWKKGTHLPGAQLGPQNPAPETPIALLSAPKSCLYFPFAVMILSS